ncbi:monothiol glutaredoxin grx5 [Emmonsiellopsis sp. PD_33]|nr:monothiol glutaredoxin grx5 [Emmonsiellopsis sp. PD_33]
MEFHTQAIISIHTALTLDRHISVAYRASSKHFSSHICKMGSRLGMTPLLRSFARPRYALPRRSPTFNLTPLQIRLLSDETRAAIDKAVASAPVVLFMKGTPETPQCGFSRASIQILGLQGVDPKKFTAFNVLEDAELRQGIKEYSDWPTIPQVYLDKEFIGGCDILMSMHQNGELAKLLEEKGVLVPAEGEEGEAEK